MRKSNVHIVFYPDNCSGCRQCQLACSYRQKSVFNLGSSDIKILAEGNLFSVYFSGECNSCGQCARACCYEALSIQIDGKEKE